MRVLIALPCLINGGTERQTLMLSSVLRSCGHAVMVLSYFEHESSMVEEFKRAGTDVILLNLDRKINPVSFILRIRREIRSVKPDIVHVQYMAPGALSVMAARLAMVRRVYATVHYPYTKYHRFYAKFILRSVALLTSCFISVSKSVEKSWFGSSTFLDPGLSQSHLPKHFTIYNSIDIERIDSLLSVLSPEVLKKEIGLPASKIIIGTVSRLRHEKGIDILMDSFDGLIREISEVHLIIVGDGSDRIALSDQTDRLGIHESVTFWGEAEWETAIRFLGIMDIVVVPSRFEGFGLTAAEAMAAGKPLIASDVFGLREIVSHNETGLLFPCGDLEKLKSALADLCHDSSKRLSMGLEGRKRAESLFGVAEFKNSIKLLYSCH